MNTVVCLRVAYNNSSKILAGDCRPSHVNCLKVLLIKIKTMLIIIFNLHCLFLLKNMFLISHENVFGSAFLSMMFGSITLGSSDIISLFFEQITKNNNYRQLCHPSSRLILNIIQHIICDILIAIPFLFQNRNHINL